MSRNAQSKVIHFAKSEDGTVAVLWGISLVVFIGFLALVFDIGRASVTQSELQTYVDHVALAAAPELDGQTGAIADATRAASDLITDEHTFGASSSNNNTNGTTLKGNGVDFTLRFLRSLPDNDSDPIRAQDVVDINDADADQEAAYIEVTAIPHDVEMPFFTSLRAILGNAGATRVATVSAVAIAGSGTEFCDVPPIFYCRPTNTVPVLDGDGNPVVDGDGNPVTQQVARSLVDPAEFGTMVRLRTGGGNSWGPGNFGFLDPTRYVDPAGPCGGLNGLSKIIGCMIGAEQGISTCVSTRGVDTDPGQSVGITDAAWNVRFDMFESTVNKFKNTPKYTAAPNIGAGLETPNNGCHPNNPAISDHTMQLPVDAIFSNPDARFSAPGSDFTTGTVSVTFNDPATGNPYKDTNGNDVVIDMTPLQQYLVTNHPQMKLNSADATFTSMPTPNGAGQLTPAQINLLTDTRLDVTSALPDLGESTAFLNTAKQNYLDEIGSVAPITRFEVYLREIAASNGGLDPIVYAPHYNPDGELLSGNGNQVIAETGLAQCTNQRSTDPFRRVVVAAEIDCATTDMKGKQRGVLPSGFALVFLTEPVGNDGTSPPKFDIWGEVLGNAKAGLGGVAGDTGRIRDVVRLYR